MTSDPTPLGALAAAIKCECGSVRGEAHIGPLPTKKRELKFVLHYRVSGEFYLHRDLVHCAACGKPALTEAWTRTLEGLETKGTK